MHANFHKCGTKRNELRRKILSKYKLNKVLLRSKYQVERVSYDACENLICEMKSE